MYPNVIVQTENSLLNEDTQEHSFWSVSERASHRQYDWINTLKLSLIPLLKDKSYNNLNKYVSEVTPQRQITKLF